MKHASAQWGLLRAAVRLSAAAACCLLLSPIFWAALQVSARAAATSRPAAPSPAAAASPPAYRQANQVGVIVVEGPIDKITDMSIKRRIQRATRDGATAIVLRLDTPGGEKIAMLDICKLLNDRNITPANVVAWVDPRAYSAGTIIALACREIVVAPNASFGDAAPIQVTPFGVGVPMPATERSKQEAPVLSEITSSARRNHYDEKLVQAFIRLGDGLWLIENAKTGERACVDLAEYREIFGEDPPKVSPTYPLAASVQAAGMLPWNDTSIPVAPTTPVSAAEAQKEFELQQSLPPTRPTLTSSDRSQWRLVRQVVDNSSLLTLTADEAIYYGLAKGVVSSDAELQAWFGARSIRTYDESWSEGLVRFLVNPLVRAILIVVFLVGLFVEFAAPGFGVFGAAAAVALLVLLGAPMLVDMASWWEIALILVGIVLVAMEVFVIPGFGIAGIGGIACILVGLVGTFVSDDFSSSGGQEQLLTGMGMVLASLTVGGVVIWVLSRHLPTLPIFNRFVLKAELKSPHGAAGAVAATSLLEAMGPASAAGLRAGDAGVAFTDLRPAGKARINDRLHDVKSAGDFIHQGTPIRVVSVGPFEIEVEEHRA